MKPSTAALEKTYLAFNIILGAGAIGVILALSNLAENPLNTISTVLVAAGTIGVSSVGILLSKRATASIAASVAEAECAKKDAQLANERAALATLETMRLRSALTWRRFNGERRTALTDALRAIPSDQRTPVTLFRCGNDLETHQFYADIQDAIQDAEIPMARIEGALNAMGVIVSNANTAIGATVGHALRDAGFDPVRLPGNQQGAPGAGTVQILVGILPPPN